MAEYFSVPESAHKQLDRGGYRPSNTQGNATVYVSHSGTFASLRVFKNGRCRLTFHGSKAPNTANAKGGAA